MGVLEDFNNLYETLQVVYDLEFCLSCQSDSRLVTSLKHIKTYFCCAVSKTVQKCILHNCVVVILGTELDARFRKGESDYGFAGTFIIDGRHFSFPNIMMNNNVLIHNFFDKQYARDKKMKRIFLYGNYDDEKVINRAIQLVYDKIDDVLYVRDVYAKDYIVDSSINEILKEYLKSSGKWTEMDFVFDFIDCDELFQKLKDIMSVDITYPIDSLSNKIIYKHSYLLQLTYMSILNKFTSSSCVTSVTKRKNMSILFPVESKKVFDTIVMGKLIQSVSRTLSKQKKYDQEYNSNNNSLEIFPLQDRIGNEVLRIINENLQQDMLKHTNDYIQFVDSFFHGEMTVAGKKFFLCHNVLLPDVNYKFVADLFRVMVEKKLFFDDDELAAKKLNFKISAANSSSSSEFDIMMVSFNNRPTKFYCDSQHILDVYYHFKRSYSPVEIKISDGILFINHHEGMVMKKKIVCIGDDVHINTLQTTFEYHNESSVVNTNDALKFVDKPGEDNTTTLMSTMILKYYKNHLHIFNTIPVAKLIVSLTNLKNGMVVQRKDYKILPIGNSVMVGDSVYYNDRMFSLWTLVRDNKLKTAEDPYIPHTNLPIEIYHYKVNRLKGKAQLEQNEEPKFIYTKSENNNIITVDGGNKLCIFGSLVCSAKINWNHDGKKYKIEYCASKNWYVYKFYMYFRTVKGQSVKKLDSEMVCEDNGNVYLKIELIFSASDLEGLKICGIHGQKGVLNEAEDLSGYTAEDDPAVHAQICLSPVSFLSRQTNFLHIPTKYCTIGGVRYPLVLIPYMFFNNTPDNIYKEFIGKNITGFEKLEGTRLDQWSINQSFMGNRLAEGLQCIRNGNNSLEPSGQYTVFKTLIHCNNIDIIG
ncbi:LEF-8 [Plodia interpunctella granulovirus]|uniref:LEF-8 n=1 Tax=Plodia interpunctella granulovirus TaxID=262175 RepID=A0A1L5JH97_9BBAC|nr:LEF-8 [Plodia interpunctella granulovirus]APO13998.1 LEF-8 [Plodia interpunctella granulovirus]